MEEPVAQKPKKDKPGKKQLAVDRTILAQERTLMAWVRTAVSFMTFGFAIYKLLGDRMRETSDHPVLDLIGPIHIAIILFSTGLVGLLLATIRHIEAIKMLGHYRGKKYFSFPLILSYIILALLAFMLFGAMIAKE